MKTVYGPVPSWRLGRSLGVDPVCAERKTCSFDCIYCQLGKTKVMTSERKEFVKTDRILSDLKEILPRVEADIITFSGTAEPTLAKNLGEIADGIRPLTDLPLAILTNSSLMGRRDVIEDLLKFDVVVAKLDAPNSELFEKINRPAPGITFDSVVKGIKAFNKASGRRLGRLALQMMFIEANKSYATEMADLVRELKPDEVQINTPLRPCAVKPLSRVEIAWIAAHFKGPKVISVYDAKRQTVDVDDIDEVHKRRPVLYSG